MAHGTFTTGLVYDHAVKRLEELDAEYESRKAAFIAKPRTKVSGWLWWKTTRQRYKEENEFLFEHGHFEDYSGDLMSYYSCYSEKSKLEDRLSASRHKAQLLIKLCNAAPLTDKVTLDEGEVAFLKLPRRPR